MPPRPSVVSVLRLVLAAVVWLGLSFGAAAAADTPPDLKTVAGQPSPPAADPKIALALNNILQLHRAGQDGYATIWDGNKYVQCGQAGGGGLRCEAAGSVMQPSMAGVLTPDKVRRLGDTGWAFDPHFGNYVRVFPATMSADQVASGLAAVLGEVYGADLTHLQVQTDWIAHRPCPQRNGPGQNLAGMINDSAAMAPTAVFACAYFDPAAATGPTQATADLIARYGPTVAGELQRLRVNKTRQVHVGFDTGLAYIQCEPDTDPPVIYCEAESAVSWPAIAAVLTPERIARLHAAGYADPGRAPNYWKTYPLDQTRDADIAAEIITLLHDVYGYAGATRLKIATETGDEP